FVEFHLVSPAEPLARLARIAKERIRFGRAEITRIDFDQHAAVALIKSLFVEPRSAPFDGSADAGEGLFREFTNRMLLARRQHVIVGLRLLHDEPHALDIIAGMPPIALGGKIAEKQLALQAELDRG